MGALEPKAMPTRRTKHQPIFLRDVYKHLRGAITGITVDAAADEILGAEMMRTPALTSEMQALAPNLRHVIRDKAHASRRLSQRPFAADPFLKDVLDMMASGRGSMARIIQNSLEARRVFLGHVRRSLSTNVVRKAVANMRAAKHRFEICAEAVGQGLYSYAFHDQDGCPHGRAWHPRWEIPREAVASMAGH